MTINAVRTIGVTLTTLMATTALAVTAGSSALAAPNDPMTNSQVTLCTGADHKREDSLIAQEWRAGRLLQALQDGQHPEPNIGHRSAFASRPGVTGGTTTTPTDLAIDRR